MHGSIIVPLDGSSFGEQALPYAFSIARRAGLPVHLVHVHEHLAPVYAPSFAVAGGGADVEIRESERDYLSRIVERTKFDRDLEIEIALIEGDVADALNQYAHDVQASLIVMSTDDRGALERFFLGSITDQVVRRSVPPVLLVHPDADDSGLDIDVHLNHLLMPLESAADSVGMARAALELGSLFRGDCTLFHVVDDSSANDFAPRVASAGFACANGDSCLDAAHAHFEALAELLREEGNKIAVKVVEDSDTAEAVLEEAELGSVDWIAISSLRRRRLSQLMFGSVADKIIHGAKVPVFVYLPHQD